MSTPPTTTAFLDLVRQSGIVSEDQLAQYLGEIGDPTQAPSQVAAVLIKRGLLTNFQARLLLAGKFRGFRVGSYLIREQLGQGGMGTVYLAEHETLRRRVALKVLAKADAAGPAGVERFLREARAAAALDHPNIVRLYDVGRQGATHYLVMEYVDGLTLEQVLTRAPIPCGRAAEMIVQAASGLQHAFEKGFVHRDIKPANLMLARDGTVKILDMGLARSFDAGDRLTEQLDQGVILGTADYISPEQALNSPDVDIRADVYSLGATFYALVMGRPPFEGNTTQKLLQHQMREPPFLCDVDPTFPPQLAEVVMAMMAKHPDDRLQTPAEVIAALAPWVSSSAQVVAGLSGTDLGRAELSAAEGTDVTLSEMMASRTRRMTGRIPAPPRRGKMLATIGGGVAVLVLGLAALVYGLGRNDEPRAAKGTTTLPPQTEQVAEPKRRPQAAVPAKSPPRKSSSKPAPVATDGQAVFRVALTDVPPFRVRFHQRKPQSPLPKVPGLEMYCWKADSVAEFHGEDGAIGVTNLNGEQSSQFYIDFADAPVGRDMDHVVRVEYRTDNDSHGWMVLRTTKYAHVAKTDLPRTGGEWRTAEVRFRRPDAPALDAVIENRSAGEGNTLYLRKFEVYPVK